MVSHMKKPFILTAVFGLALSLLSANAQAATERIDASALQFNFINVEDIGSQAAVGFSHRYENVASDGSTTVDAIVTVTDVFGIDNNDDASDGADNLIDDLDSLEEDESDVFLWVNYDVLTSVGPDYGHVSLRIDFVLHGTDTPVIVNNLAMATEDVDGRQFVQFSGIASYSLDASSVLSVLTNANDSSIPVGSYRFAETRGWDSDSSDEEFWVQVKFDAVSSVELTLGAKESGGATVPMAVGSYFELSNPVEQVVERPIFKVTYSGNGTTMGVPTPSYGRGEIEVSDIGYLFRKGYSFVEWNTAADGSGISYQPGDSFIPTGNVTLFAIWADAPVAPAEPEIEYVTKSIKQTVYFGSASAALTSKAKSQLRALLGKVPAKAIEPNYTVTGFVQGTKVTVNDLSLSKARAKNVGKYMRSRAVAGVWYESAAGRATETGAKARKVVVVVEYKVAVTK